MSEIKPVFGEDSAARKRYPIFSGFFEYFPDAIAAVTQRSVEGNEKHIPGGWQPGVPLTWDRSKSGDELEALSRHLLEHDWVGVAWRAMANLQKRIEEQRGLQQTTTTGAESIHIHINCDDLKSHAAPAPEEDEDDGFMIEGLVAYIAGPMRGIRYFNFPAFDEARDLLRGMGLAVVSPADIDRETNGFDPIKLLPPDWDWNELPGDMDLDAIVRRDLDALLNCDIVVALPGWEKSAGAKAEVAVAKWKGMPVKELREVV